MRRNTAVLLLALSILTATPTYAASVDRGFVSRFRHVIARFLGHMTTHDGDTVSPPKP